MQVHLAVTLLGTQKCWKSKWKLYSHPSLLSISRAINNFSEVCYFEWVIWLKEWVNTVTMTISRSSFHVPVCLQDLLEEVGVETFLERITCSSLHLHPSPKLWGFNLASSPMLGAVITSPAFLGGMASSSERAESEWRQAAWQLLIRCRPLTNWKLPEINSAATGPSASEGRYSY